MRSYLSLVSQYEKAHRKNSRISVLCIVLSVLLVTAVFSMADMAVRAQKNYFISTNGEYHISLKGIDAQTAETVRARIDTAVCGWAYQGCTGKIGEKTVSFAGADKTSFTRLTEMKLQQGRYPQRPDEALLNASALKQLGLSEGSTVSVTVPDGSQREYRITGILEDMGSLLQADVYGMVLNEEGFLEIADEHAKDGTTFRVLFRDGADIQKSIRQMKASYGLKDNQVSENTALLGLMGESENSMMQSFYLVAAFLVILVLIAGTVMIAAAFHTNVRERVRFYGLLRCLGASKKQVRHFVMLQGLRQSLFGVPAGLAGGQAVTWGACLLLKTVNGGRFSQIPLFSFSMTGLAAGAAVGFLIVSAASLSPAKKAAKVSPVTAVRGNTQTASDKKAANTKWFRIETGMGIYHALSGKKNLFLMICSFAVSIMMFLSFQVLVVFLNQGMPALSPQAADVSAVMGKEPFYRALKKDMQSMDGVKNVSGRMEQTDLSVSSPKEDGTVTLISYDENRLRLARKDLTEGEITPVIEGTDSVLAAYRDGMKWKTGDTLILHTAYGDKKVTVAGILTQAGAQNKAGSSGFLICSEQTFIKNIGDTGYTAIDIQLSKTGDEAVVNQIRNMLPADSQVLDKRLSNAEAQSSYHTGAVFIYGFLAVIALITVFQIFNTMNASAASRAKEYGIMRSVGMGADQLCRMIVAEAFTYAVSGCTAGCVLGLPLNRLIFQLLITDKWGISWQVPVTSVFVTVLLCFVSAAAAVIRPARQIGKMQIVDAVKQIT